MPHYKLTYSGIQVPQILFAFAGVEYDDNKINGDSEEWQTLKPSEYPVLKCKLTHLCPQVRFCTFFREKLKVVRF